MHHASVPVPVPQGLQFVLDEVGVVSLEGLGVVDGEAVAERADGAIVVPVEGVIAA